VRDVVLDSSVVLKWFRGEGERHVESARALRAAFAAGELLVFAPSLLLLEIANVAGRRWGWNETALVELAASLDALGFAAEAATVDLVTDDELILTVAPGIATPLADEKSGT
jgi:predicted nucleic acid-binding protein